MGTESIGVHNDDRTLYLARHNPLAGKIPQSRVDHQILEQPGKESDNDPALKYAATCHFDDEHDDRRAQVQEFTHRRHIEYNDETRHQTRREASQQLTAIQMQKDFRKRDLPDEV